MATVKFKDPSTGEVKTVGLPTVDYYSKNETYNKSEVDTLLENASPDNIYTKEEVDALLENVSAVKVYTATIGTTWEEDDATGVKTQNVAISGVTAAMTAKVDHVYTGDGTSEGYEAFVEAENQYLTFITNGYAETYDGGIRFHIFGDPNTVNIPIVVEVV